MKRFGFNHDETAPGEYWHVFHEFDTEGRMIDWWLLQAGCIGLYDEVRLNG